MVADKKCLALAIMDSFHDFGDGIQLIDPTIGLMSELKTLQKDILVLENKINSKIYKRETTINAKRIDLQNLKNLFNDKQIALQRFREAETDAVKHEREHIVRQTRQYILETLKKELINLFNNGKYDRREKFNYYLEKYITTQFNKAETGLSYDKNVKDSELFMTKLFYAFVFRERLYDPEYQLRGTETNIKYSYTDYRNYETRVLQDKNINPTFSSREKVLTWTPEPDLTINLPYKVLNLGDYGNRTGMFSLPRSNEIFYNWMRRIYNAKYVKYFQDATTSMPYEVLCVVPPSNLGSESPNNRSYYTGTAKSFDPGSKPPSNASTANIKPTIQKSNFTRQLSDDDEIEEPKCDYTIPNLMYELTKANGELLLFDRFKFIDPTDTEPIGTIEVTLGTLKKDLDTKEISEKSKGVEFFKSVIYEITRNHYQRAVLDRGPRDATDRKAIFTRLLEILSGINYEILKKAYLITLDKNPAEKTKFFQLSEDDYVRAILDFKRAGDFGQVAAVRAAMAYYPKEVCPIFISLDRMAILYAIYRDVPCIYRAKTDKDILIKCFNFKNRHPVQRDRDFSDNARCNPRTVEKKVNEIFGNTFLNRTYPTSDLNDYKRGVKCSTILRNALDNKVNSNENYYRNDLRQQLDRRNQDILAYKTGTRGGYESRPVALQFERIMKNPIEMTKLAPASPIQIQTKIPPFTLPSFGELVNIFVLNGVSIKPLDLIVLQFVMSVYANNGLDS